MESRIQVIRDLHNVGHTDTRQRLLQSRVKKNECWQPWKEPQNLKTGKTERNVWHKVESTELESEDQVTQLPVPLSLFLFK